MDLHIQSFSMRNFRNYRSFEMDDVDPLTMFIGPNATGKSNVLEAIQLVTSATTFRGAKSREMIRWGCERADVKAHIVSDTRDLETSMRLTEGGRNIAVNGKRKHGQDLLGILPSVMFSPEDMQLVTGAHGFRRDALDALGSQLSRTHRVLRRDYLKIVKHKNSLMKNGIEGSLLDSVNDMLVTSGAHLYAYRAALFDNLAVRLARAYSEISSSGETLDMRYVPSWEDADLYSDRMRDAAHFFEVEECSNRMRRSLFNRHDEESRRGRALVGPHADKLFFYLDGRNATLYGSQGQRRSIALSWKIAEIGLIEDVLGIKPILLLDDVASELDESRREALIGLLHHDIQTFITTTDMGAFEKSIANGARVVDMHSIHADGRD